jgi:hypothetical protein
MMDPADAPIRTQSGRRQPLPGNAPVPLLNSATDRPFFALPAVDLSWAVSDIRPTGPDAGPDVPVDRRAGRSDRVARA